MRFHLTYLLLAIFGAAVFVPFANADIISDLENHYKFESEDTIDVDSSPNGQDATDVQGVTWVLDDDPFRGGVIEFDPADGGFVHAPMVDLNTTGGEFTIAAWVWRNSETHTAGNDGVFTVQTPDTTAAGHPKIIGGWIGGDNFAPNGSVWGRVVDDGDAASSLARTGAVLTDDEWIHLAYRGTDQGGGNFVFDAIINGDSTAGPSLTYNGTLTAHDNIFIGRQGGESWAGLLDDFRIYSRALTDDEIFAVMNDNPDVEPFDLIGNGETYTQNFDALETKTGRLPLGWSAVTEQGTGSRIHGLGLTDGFLTVPGDDDDGVLGVLNLGGNAESFGPATAGHIPTWTAELVDSIPNNPQFGHDDVIADNASDRAIGISRVDNNNAGELNFEIEIAGATMRAFVFDWDLEIWGGDPDADFRSTEGPGMKVEVKVGGTSYGTMTENLLPGALFDSLEDDGDTIHNATLIDGNVHSVRGMTTGIKEISDADGAVGNMVQVNFNANWNDAVGGANGWFSAVDNVRLRALAPGDADANGVVDVADLLALLGGQKFNQGVDGVTWEQGDFNADDQFNTGDLLAMLSFLSGTFPSDPYASEAGGASDAVADIIVNSETGEVTVDLAGHTVSAVIIESASEIFNGSQPEWDTTSQFPSTLPGELGNVLFTSTTSGVDKLGAVISAEFLGRDKEFYLQDLDLNILIASEGGALTKGNVIVVPEPSTWMLLGLGSLLLVGWRQGAKRRSPGKE